MADNNKNNSQDLARRIIQTTKGATKVASGDVVGGAVDISKGIGDIILKVFACLMIVTMAFTIIFAANTSKFVFGGVENIFSSLKTNYSEWQMNRAVNAIIDGYEDASKSCAKEIEKKIKGEDESFSSIAFISDWTNLTEKYWSGLKSGTLTNGTYSTEKGSFAIGRQSSKGSSAVAEYVSNDDSEDSGVVIFNDTFSASSQLDVMKFLTAFEMKYENENSDESILGFSGGNKTAITDEDRKYVEVTVMGEAGGNSKQLQLLTAQTILDRMVKNNQTATNICTAKNQFDGYTAQTSGKGRTLDEAYSCVTESVKEAVSLVFDDGYRATPCPIYYFYNPSICGTSSYHESLNFVIEIEGERFFNTGSDTYPDGSSPIINSDEGELVVENKGGDGEKTESDTNDTSDSTWTAAEVKALKKYIKENKNQLLTVTTTEQNDYSIPVTVNSTIDESGAVTSTTENRKANALSINIQVKNFKTDLEIQSFFKLTDDELDSLDERTNINNLVFKAAANNSTDEDAKEKINQYDSFEISPVKAVYQHTFGENISSTKSSLPTITIQTMSENVGNTVDLSMYQNVSFNDFTALAGVPTGYLCSPLHPLYTHDEFIKKDIKGYPTTLYRSDGKTWHGGIDMSCPIGTPVYAMDSGRVIVSGYDRSMGSYVEVEMVSSNYTYRIRYQHLSKRGVRVGDLVKKGQIVGLSGNSGSSTGPHLHITFYRGTVSYTSARMNICNYVGLNRTYFGG